MTKEDLLAIGDLIDQRVGPLKQDLQGVKSGLERVEQKLDQAIEDNANFFKEAGIFFDKMKTILRSELRD